MAGTTAGPLVSSGIYAGESFDARRIEAGWSLPDFDDSRWLPASVDSGAADSRAPGSKPWAEATPAVAPPVRRIEELPVREILTTPSGATVLDFGQNLVGRLRIRVSGDAGRRITLRHAEVLEDGELSLRPLRLAAATDSYTLAGGGEDSGEEEWEPRFTFHGFRYAQVDNWPGELDPAAITAVVVHNDMRRTGWFECSDPMLNRLHENALWGMRGNFLALPTDCPQRDERLGWTGDIQVFSPTASYLYDSLGSSAPGCRISPSNRATATVWCPLSFLRCSACWNRPWPPGVTPPRWFRGCSLNASATSDCWPAVPKHVRLG
ncbi:alpha-L-Rhamnosidase [Arthrobacter sp. Hiyo8]|nr:alpha-L-Rhamnosidase [Arthrobacter sp. Hiyo8]